jgi:hypothetical protein
MLSNARIQSLSKQLVDLLRLVQICTPILMKYHSAGSVFYTFCMPDGLSCPQVAKTAAAHPNLYRGRRACYRGRHRRCWPLVAPAPPLRATFSATRHLLRRHLLAQCSTRQEPMASTPDDRTSSFADRGTLTRLRSPTIGISRQAKSFEVPRKVPLFWSGAVHWFLEPSWVLLVIRHPETRLSQHSFG